jgi:sRNA-binding protein
MASQYGVERARGTKEAARQIAVLREKWPIAFPVKPHDIRPLALGVANQVSVTMGWPLPYTTGVLNYWKMGPVYCQAVLAHDQRITLDGAPAEQVDAEAKDLAAKQLAKLAARNAAKQATAVKRKPAPTTEKPTQLRDQVRAGLLRRRA